MHELAVAKRGDLGGMLAVRKPAPSAGPLPVGEGYDAVTGVDQVRDLCPEVRECLQPSFGLATDGLEARTRLLSNCPHVIDELEGRVEEACPSLKIAGVERISCLVHDLYVLPRHRPAQY